MRSTWTGKRQYIRVESRQLFNAARKLLTKADFKVWIKNEFCGRSISDAYACMKLARADDTEAAVVAERVGSAERKRKSRANLSVTGADVTDKPEANIVPFVPSGGFTPRPLTPAADRPTMPGVSCPMIEIPAADQATVEKFAGQYLEGFNLIGETLIRRWWTIATAGRRQALVDLVMELAAATETAAGDIFEKLRSAGSEWVGPSKREALKIDEDEVDRLIASGALIPHPTMPNSVTIAG